MNIQKQVYSPIDIGQIAEEQKARKMKYKNDDIHKWIFKQLVKKNELGIDILGKLSNMCMFEDDFELKKFMDLFMDWYNNSPQYMLGGYSPIEYRNEEKF